jgi:chemotaxis protein methyltransferase CheR
MTRAVPDAFTAPELEQFREAVVRVLGLQFDDSRLAHLAEVFRRRLEATKLTATAYVRALEAGTLDAEVAALAPDLTVAETYFFRHGEQYRAFAEVALPERLQRALASGSRVQIASAGCASGEEPYSLVMTARETLADAARHVAVEGVDINAALIEKARRGTFSSWVLRDTSADAQRRWFTQHGREFVLDRSVTGVVTFEVRNLADERCDVWKPESLDIIFCRNVIMYFSPLTAQAVVGRFAKALKPGGYLFLGHAETLRGLSNDFHLRHTHSTFYYQRRDRLDAHAPELPLATPSSLAATPVPDLMNGANTWVEAIAKASQRIESLAASPESARGPSGKAGSAPTRGWEVGLALELLKQERFVDALDLVERFPPESGRDPEVLLLRAVLLTHSGQLVQAERACAQLLTIDELNAGAHYLFALCREGAGDRAGAVSHDQTAIYLDPGFAMAHVHLGLLARRANDRATARRELEQAIVLLQREDASRLLLFGGGFSRDALTTLCRAELARTGGTS